MLLTYLSTRDLEAAKAWFLSTKKRRVPPGGYLSAHLLAHVALPDRGRETPPYLPSPSFEIYDKSRISSVIASHSLKHSDGRRLCVVLVFAFKG